MPQVGTSSAFDVTTKGILHSALHNQYWRLIDPQGKPTGVMEWWPSHAVTFLENHDTGSTQGHRPFPQDKLSQGYAYILSHPGTRLHCELPNAIVRQIPDSGHLPHIEKPKSVAKLIADFVLHDRC
ncbi:hypothetical protein L1049_016486 [Liquidambar formosana]|uniref:1,4-alpha-D-glucan glucanohydrolase n=1 Tax=Liquidambar formosana TaxID=63359 RepID=A0AAP0X351_LIQFO